MSENIDDILEKAEGVALRLKERAEQEAAMSVALPLRFSQNIAAFRKYIPILQICMSHINQADHFVFFVMKMASQIWLGLMMMSRYMVMSRILSVRH